MGGLSKKAYQISIHSDEKALPTVLLDAGNLLFKQPTVAHSQELVTAAGILQIYKQMAYDAVAVGPLDLAAGIEFLKDGKLEDFPWLSANLTDKNHKLIFPAVRIIERGEMKIGVIGLTGQIADTSQEAIVTDWRKVLPEHLQRLTKECQLVIVISSLTGKDNAELTRQFPQVHILISADRQQGNIVPRVDNSTLITQTMNQGKYLGVLNLDWIPGSSWAKDRVQEKQTASEKETIHPLSSFSGNFIALGKNLPDDQQIAAHVEEIKQQINKHNQKLASPDKQQAAADNSPFSGLAGFASCQECHPLQTTFWNSTRHAQAYATLQRQHQNFNLDCLPCHITKNPAPKSTAPSPVEALLALPPTLQSVGCEACHGAGQAHADSPDTIKPQRKVEEKICVACHTKERDPGFDYRQKIPKVRCPAG
ncbi:MAG: hypothetical protein KJ630_03165 [Proteobacteria bacterium]|nr:hypothetical protein [Pseudomonadota bacterium]